MAWPSSLPSRAARGCSIADGEGYAVLRMTYRGEGGWSWPLDAGTLEKLAGKYVKLIGTDELFELV